MRNNALSNQQQLLERAREWAGGRAAAAPRDRSVSGDMEAIFGAGSPGAGQPGAGAPVRTIAVGTGSSRSAKRRRTAALLGGGLLLATAGAALVTTMILPDTSTTSPSVTREDASSARTAAVTSSGIAGAAAQEDEGSLPPIEEYAATDAGLPPVVLQLPSVEPVPMAIQTPAEGAQVAPATEAAPAAVQPVASQPAPSVVARPAPSPRVAAPAPQRQAAARPQTSENTRRVATTDEQAAGRAPVEVVQDPRRIQIAQPASGARLRAGRIRDSDYPSAARKAGAQGTVHVRFAVGPDGRVGSCSVTRSSGHRALDATTCQLIQRRFRYDPARNAQGRPVPDVMVGRQVWWLDRNGPPVREAGESPAATDAGEAAEIQPGVSGA